MLRRVEIAIGLILLGVLLAQVPGCYRDVRFLRDLRVYADAMAHKPTP